jgi:type II secretion system protein G
MIKIKKGFTLIELLIVMVIIALLAALSLFSLQGARESSRDAKRKSDVEAIRSALELYNADCNQYPASLPSAGSPLTATCPNSATYIEEIPSDPVPGRNYSYNPSGTPPSSYSICSALEGEVTPIGGCGSCGSATCSYAKNNP